MNSLKEDLELREIIMEFEGQEVKFLVNTNSIFISLPEIANVVDTETKHVRRSLIRKIDLYDDFLNVQNNDDLIKSANSDQAYSLLVNKTTKIKNEDIYLDEAGMYFYIVRSRSQKGEQFARKMSIFLKDLRMNKIQIGRDGRIEQGLISSGQQPGHSQDLTVTRGIVQELMNTIDAVIQTQNDVNQIKYEQTEIKQDIKVMKDWTNIIEDRMDENFINDGQATQLSEIVDNTVLKAHKETGRDKNKIYPTVWSDFQKHFRITGYKKLKQKDYHKAIGWLNFYKYKIPYW